MFGKKVELLTFDDVVAFLKEAQSKDHKEGVCLDYKREMIEPAKTAKLASAFANTNGGRIVFGVDEQDGYPVPPFEGGNLGGNPDQKVKHACQHKVSPSLKVFLSRPLMNPSDLSKGFLVVAVPQSGKTPHSVDDMVYVRTEDHKEPIPPTLAICESLLDGRKATKPRRDRILKEAGEAQRKISDKLISPQTGQPHGETMVSTMHVSVDVCEAYPDGQHLASPQEIISALERYRLLIAGGDLGQLLLPAKDNPYLETFGQGARCIWRDEGSGVIHCASMHCQGAYSSYSLVPGKPETVHSRQGESSDIWYVRAESICGLFLGQLRSALRWFRSFGFYSALHVRCSIYGSGEKQYIMHPKQEPGKRIWAGMALGPQNPRVQRSFDLNWADRAECQTVEEQVIQEYISCFNVPQADVVRAFLERSRRMVRS